MHVGLFHTRAGYRHAGGKAVFVRRLATALAGSHGVTLYTQFDPASDVAAGLRTAGVRLVGLPSGRSRVDRLVERGLPLARDPLVPLARSLTDDVLGDVDSNVDVLVTHRFLPDLVLSNAASVPVAYQYHNVQQVGAGAKLRERWSRSAIHLANSPAIADEVERKLGRRVDGIVSPGVDVETFSPDAGDPDTFDGPTLLFVGRVVERKGVFDLLEALAAADQAVSLVVVGAGDLARARRRARELGIADRVRFTGELPHEELPRRYASADVFVNPTHYEGFGMVNVEAMACGTPLLSTRIDGVESYATDGENAVLVEPGAVDGLSEAIDRLLDHEQCRRRLGEAGRETALEYDWTSQAERLVDICRATL